MRTALVATLVAATGISALSLGALSQREADLIAEQEAYYEKYGRYRQVKEDRTKPEYEPTGRTFNDATVPKEVSRVITLDGPKGKGAHIIVEYPDRTEHIGLGAYADEYTYTVPKDTATSTRPNR